MTGGILLGGRWLHVECIEPYIVSVEKARDFALEAGEAMRAQIAQLSANPWQVSSWQPMGDGAWVTTSMPTDYTAAPPILYKTTGYFGGTATTTPLIAVTNNDVIQFTYKLKLSEVSNGP